ncbi:NAD(P)-dependent glycerol-3-phosphate dehydrogenase [bacterium]|nr:NAD(P)-dependent glycerol-3-phosphate dehydrogenase [bacterium]
MQSRVGIISAGSFGTALSTILATKTEQVAIYAREQDVIDSINKNHENSLFLPGITLPHNVVATDSMMRVVEDTELLLLSTPAQFLRPILKNIKETLSSKTRLLLTSKGIEKETLKLMHQVVDDVLPNHSKDLLTILSGPTFAMELAKKTPSAAVLAGGCEESVAWVQEMLSSPWFRLYRSDDLMGVELGGSLKNVIAIAIGILEGMGLGRNSQAALMTRAIAEISRLVVALGGNAFTVMGLSGMGDLILTCTGSLSRNRQVGIALGKGEVLADVLDKMVMVAEGVATADSAYKLSQKIGVDMPIISAMYKVIWQKKDIRKTLQELMTRSLKKEIYGYGDK